MAALAFGNQIRSQRRTLKEELKAHRREPVRLLMRPPTYIGTMKVLDLLVAMPKVGRVKAQKILNQCKISPSKTIGGLTERQRGELVAEVDRRGIG